MRINVYSQELTKEVRLVCKRTDTGIDYYGVRIYLASPDMLNNTPDDDDRSAITFWIPHCKAFTADDLALVFGRMADIAAEYAIRTEHEKVDTGSKRAGTE